MVFLRCYVKGDNRLRRFPTYFLVLFLAACNLAQVAEPSSIETPIPTRTLSVQDVETTVESSQTGTSPTLIPIPLGTEASACTPPADWYEYTIARGDTITSIAQVTNSTADELIAANCLDNPNRIRVGDLIRVPNEPD